MRRIALWGALGLLAAVPSASAHLPFSDGGPADRGCKPIISDTIYVGASGKVGCDRARYIARKAIHGSTFAYWRCESEITSFGHCHGRERWSGSRVHWAYND